MKDYEGYGALARVYDILNKGADYAGYADFAEKCFDSFLGIRPALVLDLACGTGKLTNLLADRGYDMIGADGSAEMLSVAQSQSDPEKGILYLLQDMRALDLYGTVEAIICTFDAINYLLSPDDVLKVFKNVCNYLDPGGLFLFDLNTPHKFRTVFGDNAYILEGELSDSGGKSSAVFCGWQNYFDEKTGICDFYLTIFEEAGGKYIRSDEHQREKCYELDEIKKMLGASGFEFLGAFEDFGFTPAKDNAERWYIAARKAKER